MPGERLSMRKIREVLRLRLAGGLSQRAIGRSLGLSQGAVCDYLNRARRAGLSWPLPELLDDEQLERRLFPPPPDVPAERRPQPDWAQVHRDLRQPNVTLALLWEEYRVGAPDGFGYSWFCDLYREWVGGLKPTLRQVHVAGEKLFVDFAGQTMDVIDGQTGEVRQAEIFVATLGASSFTFATATWSQALPDWIAAHIEAFTFFGGVARQIISDNLKAGITKACFHEPMVNRTYADLAAHYGTAILPARPYKPRDKAKVEVGVQVVQRWILARLRHRCFFSLAELNQVIRELVDQINDRPMRGWGTTRRALYEQLDRGPPCWRYRPPPTNTPNGSGAVSASTITSRSPSTGTACRMRCCVRRLKHASPPEPSRSSTAASGSPVTCAACARIARPPCRTTVPDHMPSSHRRYRDWTHDRIRREAARVGSDAAALVDVILRSRPHPEQGFRSCIGILGLEK